jgi:hypothetical protein
MRPATQVALRALRLAGAVLPLPLLWGLLWPLAALRAAWQVGRHWPAPGQLLDSPLGLKAAPGWLRLLRRRAQLKLSDLAYVWGDRLAAPRWGHCPARDRLTLLETRTHPVVLLSLHSGPAYMLVNWLRARGIPAAMVGGRGAKATVAADRAYFTARRDRAAGLEGVSQLFETGDIWAIRDHLAANRVLIIDVDSGGDRRRAVPVVDGCGLVMSTGPLTLAAMTGAIVMTALVTSAPLFRLRVHLGEPVTDLRVPVAACEHALREYLAVMRSAPEEVSYVTLSRLRPPLGR